jgi:LysM repeat protein
MHVMEAGETLRDVAQRYGVRIKSLKKINEIDNEKLIREGDSIRLRK